MSSGDNPSRYSLLDTVKVFDEISGLSLCQFCPKKIFDIVFAAENPNSISPIPNIRQINSNAAYQTNISFIQPEDLFTLIGKLTTGNEFDSHFPLAMVESVKKIAEIASGCAKWCHNLTAILIKLKLIEIMYGQYKRTVINVQRQQCLDKELKKLCVHCNQAQNFKSEKSFRAKNEIASSKSKPKSKSIPQPEAILTYDDYTAFELPEIQEYNIYKEIMIYVINGFYEADLLEYLLRFNVPVTAISKLVDLNPNNLLLHPEICNFWTATYDILYSSNRMRIFENILSMKFEFSQEDPLEKTFLDFVVHLRHIPDIKLTHLDFIKSGKPWKVYYNEDINLRCLKYYNENLEQYPEIAINLDYKSLIMESLLLEIEHGFKDPGPLPVDDLAKYFFKDKIKDRIKDRPLNLDKESILYFETNERDILNVFANSYSNLGLEIYDINTHFLKISCLGLSNIQYYFKDYVKKVEEPHLDTKWTENTESKPIKIDPHTESIKDHIINLLYLNSVSFREKSTPSSSPVNLPKLSRHLDSHSQQSLKDSYKIRGLDKKDLKDYPEKENIYDTNSMSHFWVEKISRAVVLQDLFKLQNEYLYKHEIFCPDTDSLLVQFHDNLDRFGCSVKTYEILLPISEICARDFTRYLASDWMKNHLEVNLSEDKSVLENNPCPGVNKILNNGFYSEYHYLLKDFNSKEFGKSLDFTEKKRIYAKQLEDLKIYQSNVHQFRGHSKMTKPSVSSETVEDLENQEVLFNSKSGFDVFDMGFHSVIRLLGAKTIFHSHDGVKILIDSTRFNFEPPKCSATLSFDNNKLIVYSDVKFVDPNSDPFCYHLILDNGIVILVYLENALAKVDSFETITVDLIRRFIQDSKSKENLIDLGNQSNEIWDQKVNNYKVTSVDVDYFRKQISENDVLKGEHILFKSKDELLEVMSEVIDRNLPIYKISPKWSTYFRTLNQEVKIPLIKIISRALKVEKSTEDFNTYFTFQNPGYPEEVPPLNFRITLPNNLMISTVLGMELNSFGIKQSYQYLNKKFDEKYRIFTRSGKVVIKYRNGNIKILHFNGNICVFSKAHRDPGKKTEYIVPNYHDYRRKVARLFLRKYGYNYKNFPSRKVSDKNAKSYQHDGKMFQDLLSLPFQKVSLETFNGQESIITRNKITFRTKDYLRTFFQPRGQEFHRTDGLKEHTDREFVKHLQFPDGTIIRSKMVDHEDENSGYVYVTLEFQFDHPKYAKVVYSHRKKCEIHLASGTVKLSSGDDDNLKINLPNTEIGLSTSSIDFLKTCPQCFEHFHCAINTKNFYDRVWTPQEEFLVCEDSFEKKFVSNFVGECSRNDKYHLSVFNKMKCSHALNNDYKAYVAVYRNLNGARFLRDGTVQKFQDDLTYQQTNYWDGNKNTNIEFKKSHFAPFEMKCLSDKGLKKLYSTTLHFQLFLDKEIIDDIMNSELLDNLRKMKGFELKYRTPLKILSKIKKDLDFVTKSRVSVGTEEAKFTCPCIAKYISHEEKLLKWRKNYQEFKEKLLKHEVPKYFNSDYFRKFNTFKETVIYERTCCKEF